MKIVSASEDKNIEKRVAITPEIAKKYVSQGFEVKIQKNYATHLGFDDNLYKEQGVVIEQDTSKIYENGDIVVQLNLPVNENLSQLQENQCLIGVLDPYNNKEKLDELKKKKGQQFFIRIITKNN